MICCKCHKEISKTYGKVTDLGNYCKECAEQNEVEAVKLYESNIKSVLEVEKKNAVKEFAEKLKKNSIEINSRDFGFMDFVGVDAIDELLKEYEQ